VRWPAARRRQRGAALVPNATGVRLLLAAIGACAVLVAVLGWTGRVRVLLVALAPLVGARTLAQSSSVCLCVS
jgi:hypothetical protein